MIETIFIVLILAGAVLLGSTLLRREADKVQENRYSNVEEGGAGAEPGKYED